MSHLYLLNYACSTVTSYLSAIGCVHKLAGVNDPTETAIIRQILKGYRKLAPSHDVRLPITLPILTRLIGSFKRPCPLRLSEIEKKWHMMKNQNSPFFAQRYRMVALETWWHFWLRKYF